MTHLQMAPMKIPQLQCNCVGLNLLWHINPNHTVATCNSFDPETSRDVMPERQKTNYLMHGSR